jgi:hypothetical protein
MRVPEGINEFCSRLKRYQGERSGGCFQDTFKTSMCTNPHMAPVSWPWLVHARLDLCFPQTIATAMVFGPARCPAALVLRHHPEYRCHMRVSRLFPTARLSCKQLPDLSLIRRSPGSRAIRAVSTCLPVREVPGIYLQDHNTPGACYERTGMSRACPGGRYAVPPPGTAHFVSMARLCPRVLLHTLTGASLKFGCSV